RDECGQCWRRARHTSSAPSAAPGRPGTRRLSPPPPTECFAPSLSSNVSLNPSWKRLPVAGIRKVALQIAVEVHGAKAQVYVVAGVVRRPGEIYARKHRVLLELLQQTLGIGAVALDLQPAFLQLQRSQRAGADHRLQLQQGGRNLLSGKLSQHAPALLELPDDQLILMGTGGIFAGAL